MFFYLFYASLTLPVISFFTSVIAIFSKTVSRSIKVRYLVILLILYLLIVVTAEFFADSEWNIRIDLLVVVPALCLQIFSILTLWGLRKHDL
jgi:hypothetical protein